MDIWCTTVGLLLFNLDTVLVCSSSSWEAKPCPTATTRGGFSDARRTNRSSRPGTTIPEPGFAVPGTELVRLGRVSAGSSGWSLVRFRGAVNKVQVTGRVLHGMAPTGAPIDQLEAAVASVK